MLQPHIESAITLSDENSCLVTSSYRAPTCASRELCEGLVSVFCE